MEDLFPICPSDSLLRASSVCEGACNHILLEDFVEIVGAGEADGFGNLIYWRVGCQKELQCVVYTGGVDVVNGSFANAVLEHFGEIVGGYGYHIR